MMRAASEVVCNLLSKANKDWTPGEYRSRTAAEVFSPMTSLVSEGVAMMW